MRTKRQILLTAVCLLALGSTGCIFHGHGGHHRHRSHCRPHLTHLEIPLIAVHPN